MTTDITVLSVFYNRASAVDQSLSSLVQQDYQDFRAVIVDDGSTDDTLATLRRHASDRIEIRTQPNSGFTHTITQIANEVETEFIAIHGAGDESLPLRLRRQRDFLKANPDVVAVGCGIENIDMVSGRRWTVPPRQTLLKGPILSGFGISHGELMVRRDAYRMAGGYRSHFRYGQATDLFRRLSRLGDFGFVDEMLYRRYLMGDGVNADLRKLAERDTLDALSSTVHRIEAKRGQRRQGVILSDDLDRYGVLLPYMLPPDKLVATNLARAAIKFWTAGDRDIALSLASRSLREYPSARNILSYFAIKLGVGAMRPLMQSLAIQASKGVAEMDLARLSSAARRPPLANGILVDPKLTDPTLPDPTLPRPKA